MTLNGEWEWDKNGGRRDCIEGKERWEGNNGMNQKLLPYVNV